MARIDAKNLERVLNRHLGFRPQVYIETGLHEGIRLMICAPYFERVHGIELDAHWHQVCTRKAEGLGHVTVHHGDTRALLPEVLAQLPDTPVFVHLDAHFCQTDPPIQKSEFPLWDELALLRDRNVRDIVSVNDVHTFGKSREDLRFAPDAVEWEGVTSPNILDFFAGQVYDSATVKDGFLVWKNVPGDDSNAPRPWWKLWG